MKKQVIEFLTPILQKASEEELSIIGVGAFGSNLAYLISEKPKIIADFKDTLDLGEDTYADRMISHYIVDWVESYEKQNATETKGLITFIDSVPEKPIAISEIVKKAKELRKKFKE